ncbi:MAG: LPS export ABC transporter periplasmic protein LptC [Bacteroidota bacterium]|nr:LPS export ABC transporter periplasmic protein LptC [Candidatus Kapabacteria bacterium]MDW8220935.1 LPS export ABC transporter periplasmic protein LptC [Bacteroidota bacterium]
MNKPSWLVHGSVAIQHLCWVLTAVAHLSCERTSSAGLIKLDSNDSANHYSVRPIIQFLDSNTLRAQIVAGWAKSYDRIRRKYIGGGLHVELYSAQGIFASSLTADSAIVEDDTKNIIVQGNVTVIASGSRTTVTTSELRWDDARKKLHSQAFVRVVSAREMLQGYGFESDANLQHYTIYNVTGQALLDNGDMESTITTATFRFSTRATQSTQ